MPKGALEILVDFVNYFPDTATMMTAHVHSVRRFNRFYTRRIGVLADEFLQSPFSLTEGRVLFELAHRPRATATELCAELGLDAGYLSRILRGFQRRRLVVRTRSRRDGRQSHLTLTAAGRKAFQPLDQRARAEVAGMLGGLRAPDQARLIEAMGTIESLLAPAPAPADGVRPAPECLLRSPRPGDLGWVVHRHGALYSREHGYDPRFEALVAEIVADFAKGHDPARERCWIAEIEGRPVGSVFLVRKDQTTAKLRLLLVEPEARGLGLGRRLVAECVRFARQAGYRRVTLWTNSILVAARRIYEAAGFRIVATERHRSFGRDLVSETWELSL